MNDDSKTWEFWLTLGKIAGMLTSAEIVNMLIGAGLRQDELFNIVEALKPVIRVAYKDRK